MRLIVNTLMWDTSSCINKLSLVILSTTLIAQQYIVILQKAALPFMAHHSGAITQLDNFRSHMSRISLECLYDVDTLLRKTRSKDSSPIEYIWDLRILFSDEAHFWLNGYVNKQNCRIWSEANLQVYVETPLHPEKLTVWCALWAGGILLQKR
ncbi:hypothetical protein TNCV_1711481 [Trichonephila clavipes]|nr:hypothetical protein TNCV_1711481 [Trichonephila clavipes]